MPTNLENSPRATGLEKVSFHSIPKERQCQRMFKLPQNCTHLTCKQSSKFTKPGINSTCTKNFHMFKLDIEKTEEPGIKLPTSFGSSKKQEFQKNIYFCFIDDLEDVDSLISGSSAFSKTSLNIWKFTVHVLLKPGLENPEHYFTSM